MCCPNPQFSDVLVLACRRGKELLPKGIHFMGMGVSGGEEGTLPATHVVILRSLPFAYCRCAARSLTHAGWTA